MADGVAPQGWVAVTAVLKTDQVEVNHAMVPRRWLPDELPESLTITHHHRFARVDEWYALPPTIRLVFAGLDPDDRDGDPDYNELVATLRECGHFQNGVHHVPSVIECLPKVDPRAIPDEEEHVVIVFSMQPQRFD